MAVGLFLDLYFSGYALFWVCALPGVHSSGYVTFRVYSVPGILFAGYVLFIGKIDDFCFRLDQNWVNRGSWLVFRYVLCRACTVPGRVFSGYRQFRVGDWPGIHSSGYVLIRVCYFHWENGWMTFV